MSSFPAIMPGMKVKPLGSKGIMTRTQANFCLAVCNGVANSQIINGDSNKFNITPNNATYQIASASASIVTPGLHPFQVYPTGTTSVIAGITCIGYNVRSGYVSIRPRFHMPDQRFHRGGITGGNGTEYAQIEVPPECDGIEEVSSQVVTPAEFYLDPTPEIVSGANYGAIYSFYIEIISDTDSGGGWDGSVSLKCRRFSIYSPDFAFPSQPDASGKEYLPIAILQLTVPTASGPLFSATSGNGAISQLKRDHYTGRFFGGQTSLNGFCNVPEDWILPLPDASVASGNRVWYPGDTIYYYTGTGGDAFNGFWIWRGAAGQLGGTPTTPVDGASSFSQIAQFG